jgi:hypothetical protein
MQERNPGILNGREMVMSKTMSQPCLRQWHLSFAHLFGASQRTSQQLWGALYPSEIAPILYNLARCADAADLDTAIVNLWRLVSPSFMLTLTLRVSGETKDTGQLRDRAIVQLEERILRWVDRHGKWKGCGV